MEWLISLLCGAGGGNIAGALMKKLSLGTLWNSVVGILGGGIGQAVLGAIGGSGGESVLNQVAAGGVGGGVLMVIVAFLKKAMAK
jgi:uncharacterized membrane protein YeaQ/YmgE (transglycosylase-associated protein family)